MTNDYYENLAKETMNRAENGCNFIVTIGYRNHYFACIHEAIDFALTAYYSSDDDISIQFIDAINEVKIEDSTQVDNESEENDNEQL